MYLRARSQSDPNAPGTRRGADDETAGDDEGYDAELAQAGARSRLDREVNDLLTELES